MQRLLFDKYLNNSLYQNSLLRRKPENMDIENKTKVSDTDKKNAEALKNKGNECFKKEEYQEAIDYYTKAIVLNHNDASYYCNRAACYLKLKKYILVHMFLVHLTYIFAVITDASKILTQLLNLMKNILKLIEERLKHILVSAICM